MKQLKRHLLLATALVIFCVILSTNQALAATEISSDVNVVTTWTKSASPYIIRKSIFVNAPLTIEPGVVVKFKNLSGFGLGVKSPFTAIGTPSEPIVFTSTCDDGYGGETKQFCSYSRPLSGDWGGIYAYPQYRQPATLEYVKIFYANYGIKHETNDLFQQPYRNYLNLKHSEIRYCQAAGIFLRFTQPTLDGLILANNRSGIQIFDALFEYRPKIRNSAIFDNGNGVEGHDGGRTAIDFDARYNWWGDASGPYYSYQGNGSEADNLDGTGNRITGTRVLFRPWAQSDPNIPKEPVIFIPGIGASLNPDLMISGVFSNNWTMFDHTYDGILTAFRAMGYVEGQNFFIAYYDWRKSNAQSVENYLKPLIQQALAKSDSDKVNIVTHSMGSLVARSYVQSDSYASDVDNLIMIAPPNRGSSDVYAAWEGGYIPKNWATRTLMYAYLDYINIKKLTFNTYDTIHKFIPSLKELMPTYDYLRLAGSGELKSYQAMHEQNNFLQSLSSGIDKLNERTRLSIILGDNQDTVNKIPVVDSDKEGIWQDGKPDPIDPERDDEKGDGEVLISSGDIASDFRDVLEYDHREIVSKSEKIVAERLGKNLADIFDAPEISGELILWTDAPANLQITDPMGATVSRDKEEIENSRYAEEQSKDGFKIVSVPNPKKGTYQIKLSGHSTGEYHVGVEYASLDGKNADKSEIIEVEVKPDEEQEYVLPSDPQNPSAPIAPIIERDVTEPVLTISSPQNGKAYGKNEKVAIQYIVSDNRSEAKNIVAKKYFDYDEIVGDTLDLSGKEVGEYEFSITATDEAENSTDAYVSFRIVEAPPADPIPDPIPDPTPDPLPDPTPDPLPEPTPPPVSDSQTPPVTNPENTISSAGTSNPAPVVENSSKKKKKKKKHKKKSKKKSQKKKASKKTQLVVKKINTSGVKKYHGKIKVESSTVNYLPGPLSVKDVFGEKFARDLEDQALLEASEISVDEVIFPTAKKSIPKNLKEGFSVPPENKQSISDPTPNSSFNPKLNLNQNPNAIRFDAHADFKKFNARARVAGASTVRALVEAEKKHVNYPLWGSIGVFLLMFAPHFGRKIKRRRKSYPSLNTPS